jgi:sec-independent protein translocase protein TatA
MKEDVMFGLGTGELLIILLLALLVFGASRLPELGKGLGQGMRSFKDALKGEDRPQDPPRSIDSDTTKKS